ncbi:hypothetical protein GCM10023093_24440 [Nemorincola caseinilytica]|uniref:Lipoprotein n=1 Tax=Nemorincola caseinilytica TaxID=2054315 RepID=A0ABP8NJ15_9BACT
MLLLLLSGCDTGNSRPVHAFYYWRTTFDDNDTVSAGLIDRLDAAHFYIRYMDVDIDKRTGQPVPVAAIGQKNRGSAAFTGKSFTPVVFITARVFGSITDAGADTLAEKIADKVAEINHRLAAGASGPKELQIDCDWTAASKERYFRFLRRLRTLEPGVELSATIRAYPYKYRTKMGVPPVDRGMLMCYNMGGISNMATKNSVFDAKELGKYLTVDKYPLPLDAALPVFGWQVWFGNGKYKGIIHEDLLTGNEQLYVREGDNRYRFVTDTVLGDRYFREGDVLRAEYAGEHELIAAADMLHKKLPDMRRLAFFDWNTTSIIRYEHTIQAIYSRH